MTHRPPMFFHSSTLCLYQNGCVISSLWRNTEVVSPLSCFLFHFYRMKGNKVEPWSPHTREFPISTSIPGPSLLHGEWILYLWCQWLEPQRTEGDYPSVKSYNLLQDGDHPTSTSKEKQLLRRLICETGSWSMRRLHHGLPDYIKCQQHFGTFWSINQKLPNEMIN